MATAGIIRGMIPSNRSKSLAPRLRPVVLWLRSVEMWLGTFWFPTLETLKIWIGNHARHGVVANNGSIERDGFVSRRHAQHWAWRHRLKNFEFYEYDTRQKRLASVSFVRSSSPPRA